MAEQAESVARESQVLARHSLAYGIGNLLNRFVGFLLIPFYTRYLVPADYGILELVGLTTGLVAILLSARLSRAVYRFYFEYEELNERNEVVSTAILSFGVIGLLGLVIALPSSGFLAKCILNDRRYSTYFLISFTTLWFSTVVSIGQYYLQAAKRSLAFVTLSFIQLVITVTFNIYFVAWKGLGVAGVLWGNLIGSIASFAMLIVPILCKVGVRLSRRKMLEMLRYGLPLIPGALSNFFVLVSDRFFVAHYVSLAATGIYSLSYKFGVLPDTFITVPFFQSWAARRLELMKDDQAERVMGRIVTYFLIVLTFVALAISVLIGDALKIMADRKYWTAALYVPVLVSAYVVYGLFNQFQMPILITKKTHYMSYIDVSNGIINIALNFLLISRYGTWGACVATFLSYTMRIVMVYWIGSRLGKIYFEFGRFARIVLAAGTVYVISSLVGLDSPWRDLAVRVPLLLLFPIMLYVMRCFDSEELRRFGLVCSSGKAWLQTRLRVVGAR